MLLWFYHSMACQGLVSETYQKFAGWAPDGNIQHLYSRHSGAQGVAEKDSAGFKTILPLWAIKPLYIWTTYIVHKIAVEDVVHATTVVSTISTGIIIFLLGWWLLRHVPGFPGLAIATIIAVVGGLPNLAGLARPDGLSALLVFTCLYALIEHRNLWFTCVLAALAVLARPDNILLAGLLGVYLALFTPGSSKYWSRVAGMALLIAATSIYILVQHLYGGYGWSKTFYIAFVEPMSAELLSKRLVVTPYMYLERLYWSLNDSISTLPFITWITINVCGVVFSYFSIRRNNFHAHILMILVSYNLIHWLVFPSFELRFFIASYLVMLCTILLTAQCIFRRTGLDSAA